MNNKDTNNWEYTTKSENNADSTSGMYLGKSIFSTGEEVGITIGNKSDKFSIDEPNETSISGRNKKNKLKESKSVAKNPTPEQRYALRDYLSEAQDLIKKLISTFDADGHLSNEALIEAVVYYDNLRNKLQCLWELKFLCSENYKNILNSLQACLYKEEVTNITKVQLKL